MEKYKKDFTKFLLDSGALKFGDFTLKSGRKSPFFMNLGELNDGRQLQKLGRFYAQAITHQMSLGRFGDDFNVVFGPAYKGIPLAVATVMELERYGIVAEYCANRKEIKDHGDAGILLGRKLQNGDRVLMIEDVTTSGKSIDETVPIIRAQADVEIVGLVVSLDRHERGNGLGTALAEISEKYGFPAAAIVTMPEVVTICEEQGSLNHQQLWKIERYYGEYGPVE